MKKMAIPATMKAAQVVKHQAPLEFRDVPVPQPENGEVLIKLECTGVCHTDLHVQEGDWEAKCALPRTPGHEGVGKVVALGPNVTNVAVGDRVCTPWLHGSCKYCEQCWGGWETVCAKTERTGFSVNGSFAEYIKAPADFVGVVPEGLSSEQAAPITCAGVTVYKGLKVSDVRPGQWIVIAGAAGGLGHVAVQYAKAMGMKVIGLDAGAEKMTFLKKLGCEATLDAAAKGNICDEVMSITGDGAHGALILVPRLEAISDAVKYLRPCGCVVQLALPAKDFSVSAFDVVVKAITIKGSIVGTRLDLKEALDWAAAGKVKCNVETKPFNIANVNGVLDDLRTGKIKGRVVLTM